MYSFFARDRNDMAYCHFELCRDCRLGCFSELLADTRRLSVVAVVFLYQITFLQQNTTASLLELYFNNSMQTVYDVCTAAVTVNKERSPMGPM